MAPIPFTLVPDNKAGISFAPQVKDSQPQGFKAKVSNFLQTKIGAPITNAVQSGADSITQGFADANPLQGGIDIANGLATGAGAFLAPIMAPISNALAQSPAKGSVMDKLQNSPEFQKFAVSSTGQMLSTVLSNTGKLANIAGATIGLGTGVDEIQNPTVKAPSTDISNPTKTSSYNTNLANATAANNQAGATAVKGANEASGMVYNAKADAGTQFSEAPKLIMNTEPNVGIDLSNTTAEKLNALKDTKAFSLPDYIRPGSDNFGNGNIDIAKLGQENFSGIRLNPIQTQDLITRLNDLMFNSKGDVVVNQQTQGLINDIKSQAQDTFGHITDAQGNSLWNNAYQKYSTTMDAVHAASDIINVNKTSGGMSNPVDVDGAIKKVLSLQDTPQGRANISQFVQEFKNRTGYDLSDPIQAQTKLIESNTELQNAIKGGYGKQLQRAMTNPSAVGRRLLYATTALVGLTAIGTTFRKQISNFLTGQ